VARVPNQVITKSPTCSSDSEQSGSALQVEFKSRFMFEEHHEDVERQLWISYCCKLIH
jgi:hypothetical protein